MDAKRLGERIAKHLEASRYFAASQLRTDSFEGLQIDSCTVSIERNGRKTRFFFARNSDLFHFNFAPTLYLSFVGKAWGGRDFYRNNFVDSIANFLI